MMLGITLEGKKDKKDKKNKKAQNKKAKIFFLKATFFRNCLLSNISGGTGGDWERAGSRR